MTVSVALRRLPGARMSAGLFILLSWFPLVAAAATYGGGGGTMDNPFLIQTAEQFALIGDTPTDWGKHFRLVSDIDLAAYDQTSLRPIGRWAALGSNANQPFYGSFDGGGRTIRGFQYKDMQSEYVGLFQYVKGHIRDLHVARANVTANGMGVGILVGRMDDGMLTGCSVTQARVSGNIGVGALAGFVGGSLHTCWSDGSVSGVQYVGGLIGRISGGTIARSYSKAAVAGDSSIGGLFGIISGEMSLVESCYATGRIDGNIYVGGLVGQMDSGVVETCYSVGKVSGQQLVGGLIGHRRVLAEVLISVWDMETSGQATSAGGTGSTTAEMKSIDTYLTRNWNFAVTWAICEGVSYPILFWQIPVGDLRCPDGVDFTDFAWFAANWRHGDCGVLNYSCDGADLDGAGQVDPRDLALFSANWLAGVDW